jgi:hypothetical protein
MPIEVLFYQDSRNIPATVNRRHDELASSGKGFAAHKEGYSPHCFTIDISV